MLIFLALIFLRRNGNLKYNVKFHTPSQKLYLNKGTLVCFIQCERCVFTLFLGVYVSQLFRNFSQNAPLVLLSYS